MAMWVVSPFIQNMLYTSMQKESKLLGNFWVGVRWLHKLKHWKSVAQKNSMEYCEKATHIAENGVKCYISPSLVLYVVSGVATLGLCPTVSFPGPTISKCSKSCDSA